MAKLNKIEINAFAKSIVDQISPIIKKQNEEAKMEAFNKWLIEFDSTHDGMVLRKYKELQDRLGELTTEINSYPALLKSYDSYIHDLFYKRSGFKIKYIPDINQMEREIIIAQAKNGSIDEIVAKLIEKYS